MWSLATIPGKRFVIPRNSRTGGAAAIARDSTTIERQGGGASRAPPRGVCSRRCLERRRGLDLALDDERLLRVHLRDEALRYSLADLADVLTPVLQVEDE